MHDEFSSAAASTNGQPSLKERVKELQLGSRLDGGGSSKSGSSTSWLPWMLCIFMALAWAGVGIRGYKSNSAGSNQTGTNDANAKAKQAETGKSLAVGEIVLESKGYLIPSHQISVSPIDVAGRITELNIEEGKTFKKDAVLAKIDSTRFEQDMKEAEAQFASTKAKLDELVCSTKLETEQAEFELEEARHQKAEALLVYDTARTTALGAVAKLDVGQANKKYDAAGEHVKALEKKLEIVKGSPRQQKIFSAERDLQAAQARLVRAKWTFDNCTIRSPVTGVILTKKAEVGSLINPVVGGVSTSLCEIADLSEIEVDLEIQERDIAKIRVGMQCRIRPDAHAERVYYGYFERMMPIANRARGIIPVRVRVLFPANEEQGKYLKPEMAVSVTFINVEMLPQPYPEGVEEPAKENKQVDSRAGLEAKN